MPYDPSFCRCDLYRRPRIRSRQRLEVVVPYASEIGGLVLNRRVGEEIIIGEGPDETVIVVEAASGGRVQLRLVAPDHIRIQRAELKIGKERRD